MTHYNVHYNAYLLSGGPALAAARLVPACPLGLAHTRRGSARARLPRSAGARLPRLGSYPSARPPSSSVRLVPVCPLVRSRARCSCALVHSRAPLACAGPLARAALVRRSTSARRSGAPCRARALLDSLARQPSLGSRARLRCPSSSSRIAPVPSSFSCGTGVGCADERARCGRGRQRGTGADDAPDLEWGLVGGTRNATPRMTWDGTTRSRP